MEKLKPVERFFRLLQPDSKEITNVYFLSVFIGLVNLSLPIGIQAIINLIQGGRPSTAWVVLVVFVVLGIAIVGILQIFQLKITENLQQKIFSRAAVEFAFRIPRFKMEKLYTYYAPELINRFFDTMSVQKGLPKILIDFTSSAFLVFFGLILLSIYHPFFIFFSLLLVALIGVIFYITGQKGLDTSLEESRHKYKVAHWLEELARTHTSFKWVGKTDLPLVRADERVHGYIKARESHFKILLQQFSMMVGFKVLVATGLLAMGGFLVMDGQMNIGQFVAAEIIILLIMSSVEKLILSLENIYDVLTSLEKLGQVTDFELEPNSGLDLDDNCEGKGTTLELENVSFSYPLQEKNTLRQVSFTVDCGEHVIVKGENGAGKTSLMYLLAGLYRPSSGTLTFQGIPVHRFNPERLRSAMGICFQEESLFEGSLEENIGMGRDQVSKKRIREILKSLKLDRFVNGLSEGLDTRVDPDGRRLPRSVVQKILIARAIVDRPKLLLLEDVFEHIDEQEVKEIIDYLLDPEHGWTVVGVSANPYFSKRVDKIIEIQDGSVRRIQPNTSK